MKEAEIFCDGACSGNPGPGGYGCIVRHDGEEKELSGNDLMTTNNKMELTAAIKGLETLAAPSKVVITTDSQYLVKGMTEWLKNWQERGWMTTSKKPVLNRELWECLAALARVHDIEWVWVKGHEGHYENERCDELARMAIKSFR